MVTLDDLLDRGEAREQARLATRQAQHAAGTGLYWAGFAAAKLATLLVWCVAAPLVAAGFVTSRWVWPSLLWCRAAFLLGFETGRRGSA